MNPISLLFLDVEERNAYACETSATFLLGGKLVWVHGRDNRGSSEELDDVRKVLLQIGQGWENVPLYPSGCGDFKFFDRIVT